MHYQKYEARNEPMPMAAVIGHHPVLDLATNSSVPYGVDEFQVAGSLLQEPLEMVRCETVNLMVPAHAEIVIEGVIPPGIREDEGPFGEFQCYYLTRTRKCPVFDVKAITMRRDALTGTSRRHLPRSSIRRWSLCRWRPISGSASRTLTDTLT